MNMNQVLRSFINSASVFEKQKNYDTLLQSLQILSFTDDLSIFDASSFEAADFYTLLHDLLTNHSKEAELVWNIINVLQVAIRNPSARSALVHTYHFIHPLTTILEVQYNSEKKLSVLKILQELSYGVVICWQEAHLPKLIKLLLDIISGDDNKLIPIALGVMVNLCHKNKPAMYTLMNCVDIKGFLRTVLNLQRENVETSVQVCKLLMVLNYLSGNVPDAEILSFVRVSFLRINKAFNCNHTFLMRHIVDFFRDAKESEHGRKVLLTYPKYQEELSNLINTLSSKTVPNDWQCVQQLVEFIHQLVDLELSTVMPFFTRIACCIVPWVQVGGMARTALHLLSTMLHQCRHKNEEIHKSLSSCIETHLMMFVEVLHNGCRVEHTTSEVMDYVTSLLHLFRECAASSGLSTAIAQAVDKEELKKLLLPVMTSNNIDGAHLFQQPVSALYVEILSLVAELSMENNEWLSLYSDLLQKRQILKALAVALYSGSYNVKKQVLYLASTSVFSADCLNVFSKCLTDLNELFVFASNTAHTADNSTLCHSPMELTLSLPVMQTEALNGLVENLGNSYRSNTIQDSPLSKIIELYNYKITEMRRAEQCLQRSLEAADTHRTQLLHRIAQLSAETSRLHQLLYSGHQTLEGTQMELVELREQLNAAQESASSSHLKFMQLKQDVHSKNMITQSHIERQQSQIEGLEKKVEELNKDLNKLETEKSDLLSIRDNLLSEKEVLINNKLIEVQSLEQVISKQQCLIKGLEKSLKDKEKEILDLERIRKTIFDITAGK